MTGARWAFIGISLLILAALACNTATPTPAPVRVQPTGPNVDSMVTFAYETMTAEALTVAAMTPPTTAPSIAPRATEPFIPPSPTFTFSPAVPMLSVSAPTHCRLGPGQIYESIAIAEVGIRYSLLGRHTATQSWIILLPDGRSCWVWGQYASLEGNVDVPEIPPPVGTVGGVVLNTYGNFAVRDAPVRILPLNKVIFTDNTGHYKFENVPIGNLTISVELPSEQPVTRSIRLQANQVINDVNFLVVATVATEAATPKP